MKLERMMLQGSLSAWWHEDEDDHDAWAHDGMKMKMIVMAQRIWWPRWRKEDDERGGAKMMMSMAVQIRWWAQRHKEDDDDERNGAIKSWRRTLTMQEQESPTLMEHHLKNVLGTKAWNRKLWALDLLLWMCIWKCCYHVTAALAGQKVLERSFFILVHSTGGQTTVCCWSHVAEWLSVALSSWGPGVRTLCL